MTAKKELETSIARFSVEVTRAHEDARQRLRQIRQPKLGDLNLRDDFYLEITPLMRLLCNDRVLRRDFIRIDEKGYRLRLLLLVFMSEMIYWEYDRSFWDKLREVLDLRGMGGYHTWFTARMERAFQENAITLVRGRGERGKRRLFVRTIMGEAGFSRQLVRQAKDFTIWFFDHYPDLDPRHLNVEAFEKILAEYGRRSKRGAFDEEEVFDLLLAMVRSVSLLLREIRKRSFTSVDLDNAGVLDELATALGFHPVRGIYGFRTERDVQELLEQLSTRVRPETFRAMLFRKVRGQSALQIMTPEGNTIQARRVKDVPIMFGEYQLFEEPRQREVQVVPREAIPLSRLAEMLENPPDVLYSDGSRYAWIHSHVSFEVFQGTSEPEEPLRYSVHSRSGYLWYGRQRVGMSLEVERDGEVIAELAPMRDVQFNPRLRLNWERTGLEVVIPSFVCYEPGLAGLTVRLELNDRPIEDTTYVVGHNGMLQFQSTRVAPVLPDDRQLSVRLVATAKREEVGGSQMFASLEQAFLFGWGNRELIRPGHRLYGSDRFALFNSTGAPIEVGDSIYMEAGSDFGPFKVHYLTWNPDPATPQPFMLSVGEKTWSFERPLEIQLSVTRDLGTGALVPQEYLAVFSPENVAARVHFSGQASHFSEAWPELRLIVEKDEGFLTDFSFPELERMKALCPTPLPSEFVVDIPIILKYLKGRRYMERATGSYRLTLSLRPDPSADLEILSEADFILLPGMRVEGTDACMVEGKEQFVTVFCEAPVMIDEEERLTDVLQIDCRPETYFDVATGSLQPQRVDRTVRLAYPPTKVAVRFDPCLSALRLVCGGKLASGLHLTYEQAETTRLVALAPSKERVVISGGNKSEVVETGEDGHGTWPLAQLLPAVHEERTSFRADCGAATIEFSIVWHAALAFKHDRCELKRVSPYVGALSLAFDVKGPPCTSITFKLVDNRLRNHGENTFLLASITGGTAELTVDLAKLTGASMLFCTAYTDGTKQDSTGVLCEGVSREEAQAQVELQLQRLAGMIDKASALELPRMLEELDTLGDQNLLQRALRQMFSLRRLTEIYEYRQNRAAAIAYFERFEPAFFDYHEVPIYVLKWCCEIPNPSVQLASAEALILRNDGVGVEKLIELLAAGRVEWDEGIGVLSRNRECASEMIHDIVQWDDLEQEDTDYIDLMERLCRRFHPPMARRARAAKDWKRALTLLLTGEIIKVNVTSWNLNGLVAPMGLIIGQIPIEEIDFRSRAWPQNHKVIQSKLPAVVGQSLEAVVAEVDRRRGRLVLSERRARARRTEGVILELQKGTSRKGKVVNIRDFGVFVDIGGVTGLVHRSELSWDATAAPQELVGLGDEIEVSVTSVDKEHLQVNLSRKAVLPDPLVQKYALGQVVVGRATEVRDVGVNVLLEDGVEGFVPASELSTTSIAHPRDVVERGSTLDLRVLRIDAERRRLILSLRQVGEEELYWGRFRVKPGRN